MSWSISTSRPIAPPRARCCGAVRLVLVRSRIARPRPCRARMPDRKRFACSAPAFRSPTSRFASATWPNDGAWHFLQAGRLIEKKGLRDQPARLRRHSARRYPDAHFHDRGRRTVAGRTARRWRASWDGRQVRFPGFFRRQQLREHFYASHIFLHPSETGRGWKSGRRSEFDAGSDGQRPAGFRDHHGGIPEAIEDGVSGVLVEEGDHDALAHALLDWTGRPEILRRLARARCAARWPRNSSNSAGPEAGGYLSRSDDVLGALAANGFCSLAKRLPLQVREEFFPAVRATVSKLRCARAPAAAIGQHQCARKTLGSRSSRVGQISRKFA